MIKVATAAGPWSVKYRTTTIGIFALAFLVAFESLAVTTVMPVVADDLDGLRVYGLAFAMPMAVSVFALTFAGLWMDNHDTAPAMRVGAAVFAGGRSHDAGRAWWSLIVAVGLLVVSVAGQRDFTGWPIALGVAMIAVVVFASRLLPAGTWRLRPGLPGVIVLRGLTSAAFFAAEVYVPLSLVNHHGFSPAIMQSMSLSLGSVAFAALLTSEPMLGYLANFSGAFAVGLVATLAAPRLLKRSGR